MEKTELVSELKRWCRGEGLDETHAFMTIVPEDVEISEVEEMLETIKSLGRVRVRGRNFSARWFCVRVKRPCERRVFLLKLCLLMVERRGL
uniref:Paraneoplastic antigen Ma-like N-terminal domain-containing protein n=1 Tax=Cyprinus carpio TaxID=7962 RepID=A0A8C1X231_CYPCA